MESIYNPGEIVIFKGENYFFKERIGLFSCTIQNRYGQIFKVFLEELDYNEIRKRKLNKLENELLELYKKINSILIEIKRIKGF